MSLFAQIQNNVVINVFETDQETINSGLLGDKNEWLQVDINTFGNKYRGTGEGSPFRGNCPSVGFIYDPVRDIFYPPQPHASWTFNEQTYLWEPPFHHPIDDNFYWWSEEQQNWIIPKLD